MHTKPLRTSDLAKAVGIHPNTVRLYEQWGLIPPVPRSETGYRLYSQEHLDCLRLARLVFSSDYPGQVIRTAGREIIRCAVQQDWQGALERAREYLALVRQEIDSAETAANLLETWAMQPLPDQEELKLSTSQTAALLRVTQDVLRNWERNGLIQVPRNSHNQYRLYGQREVSRLRIIRMLSRAGYSHMAMLRMFLELDNGNTRNLREVLDTPRFEEDIFMASDHWLTALYNQERLSDRIIEFIQSVLQVQKKT